MTSAPRARFAPAPTGELHVGGARTALFNWLFVRGSGGTFVLRIDDTDRERSSDDSFARIIDSLRWLGIDWDEGPDVGGPWGPYRQSERTELYRKKAEELIASGHAYRCFCSPEDLESMRRQALQAGRPPRYDGRCSSLDQEEVARRIDAGDPFVVRLRVPESRIIEVDDIVRGRTTFDTSEIEDFVILRADGTATFLFAGAYDDVAMQITHVIRGEDLFSATPRQILVIEALGAKAPNFAHLPLIVGEDRQPLSKRHGDVALSWYREAGFMPETLFNYLALLGWSPPGDSEILSREELIASFRLDQVKKSPAFFDMKKLEWMNNHYLQSLDSKLLADRAIPFLVEAGLVSDPPAPEERQLVEEVIPLVQVRMDRLSEIVELTEFLFRTPHVVADDWKQVMGAPWAASVLREMRKALEELPEDRWNRESIEAALRQVATAMNVKPRLAFGPLRVAVSGRRVGPPLFESLELLGRQVVLERTQAALDLLEAAGADLGPGLWPLVPRSSKTPDFPRQSGSREEGL
jgi:nondiscriminating glutamyl-tRNA synthetase